MNDEQGASLATAWRRPMIARDTAEPHRAATPLELLFDLCFVVAVAQAADRLHHSLAEDHVAYGVLSYVMVFFGIWWAWMNFSWFASAYDTDDVPYRLAAFVQIVGALTFAAGIPRAFDHRDFAIAVIGYVVMRTGLVANWLRAAAADPDGRTTALRFAAGVTLCQVGWLSLLALPEHLQGWAWLLLVPAELAVPLWAEHARRTPWHPRHIAERYGLFTIFVLGESILAGAFAIQSALDHRSATTELYAVIGGGLLTVFGLWWLYFAKPAHVFLVSNRIGFVWGYGHYLIFSAGAAVGAGLAVAADYATHHAEISGTLAGAAVTVPVAIFVVATWAVHHRPHGTGPVYALLEPGSALLILAATFTGAPVVVTGLILAALVTVSVAIHSRSTGA
jgi:low temperature requirement protein LtrA